MNIPLVHTDSNDGKWRFCVGFLTSPMMCSEYRYRSEDAARHAGEDWAAQERNMNMPRKQRHDGTVAWIIPSNGAYCIVFELTDLTRPVLEESNDVAPLVESSRGLPAAKRITKLMAREFGYTSLVWDFKGDNLVLNAKWSA